MRIDLFGGFGEKGRTSIGISAGKHILLDVGIKVGTKGREYYPMISAEEVKRLDAAFVSHAHEDHIGGVSWLLANGFSGIFYMTQETWDDADAMLTQYAEAQHFNRFPLSSARVEIFRAGDTIRIADMEITAGRSGHVAGGVWLSLSAQRKRVVYCGDVVPESNVFVMDPIPECDLLFIDASYGGDAISVAERRNDIQQFINKNATGCLLPVPLSGKPLELMAILPSRFAIHSSMRSSIQQQIQVDSAISEDMVQYLNQQLARAIDWDETMPFPSCPLLTFDGMGSAGPSVIALQLAAERKLPILLTGHVPPATPAEALIQSGQAKWLRLPTHPTAAQNVHIWEQAGKPDVLGHSCLPAGLEELKPHINKLKTGVATGYHFEF